MSIIRRILGLPIDEEAVRLRRMIAKYCGIKLKVEDCINGYYEKDDVVIHNRNNFKYRVQVERKIVVIPGLMFRIPKNTEIG